MTLFVAVSVFGKTLKVVFDGQLDVRAVCVPVTFIFFLYADLQKCQTKPGQALRRDVNITNILKTGVKWKE